MTQASITLPKAPEWATAADVADVGTPAEWIAFNGLLATTSPVVHFDQLTRDQELRLVGWQYNQDQGDIPAGTTVIEVVTKPIDPEAGGNQHTGLFLTVDAVPRLIDALTEALAKLGHAREADIRGAGKFVVGNLEAAK